jgi:hypothetical protein
MANFNQASVAGLVSALSSIAQQTGIFRSVNFHEPKSAPGSGLRLAVWVQSIEPLPEASGAASTSGYVVCFARIYGNMLQKPEDDLDPHVMTAATVLIGAYSADFTLGGTVRNSDLLGAYGQKLSALAGYVEIGGAMYRQMTVTVPAVINDMWEQVA